MAQLALIWDMDGTLVDSYPAIVPAARETLASFGIELGGEEVHREVIASSVGALLERIARERGLDPAPLKADFASRNDSRIQAIRPMPHAADCLEALRRAGHRSFVYTTGAPPAGPFSGKTAWRTISPRSSPPWMASPASRSRTPSCI